MKVLLVDDNEEITEVVSFYLERIDIPCTVIRDGREALKIIKDEHEFDLILLDIAMPDFSGLDVLNELKKEKLVESKNIVIFTASNVNEKELLLYGIKGIIRKPLSIDALQEAIYKFR